MISHTLRGDKASGGVVIVLFLGCMVVGPLSPLIAVVLGAAGRYFAAAAVAMVAALTLLLDVPWSPAFCRLYLRSAGWFRHGVTLHLEDGVAALLGDQEGGTLCCMHPHGTAIGFGFSINGAIRFKACDPRRYLPEDVSNLLSHARLKRISGVMAPLLFKLPLIRSMLLGVGCSTPATKESMLALMDRRCDFGILPGGMEEVALYKYRRERVFLRGRKGFIKYALQHGYYLLPSYTFGESDLYHNLEAGAGLRMWMQKRLGFIVPVFWGPRWWCPLLPDDTVRLHTVIGNPVCLPRLQDPSAEDVAKWHGVYVDALLGVFERHKASLGYADRTLEIL